MITKSNLAVVALAVAQTLFVAPNLVSGAATSVPDTPDCKCTPEHKCWPKESEWASLNKTTGGHLIKSVPPASVCYEGPFYNKQTCQTVNDKWNSSLFHIADPSSIFYPNFANSSCLPVTDPKNGTCTIGAYPVYVVNATTPSHVKAGIAFAKKHNIRLVVKGTGHDFLGKSTGYGSLSIWTHNMKQLDFHESFTPRGYKTKPVKAVTIGAGLTMAEIYKAANDSKVTVIGGADFSVGIGGYLTGGGHSPISSHYGLACQQALEYEIVTADGKVVTANKGQNTELYYAFSGGGGSTFGVMTSVTVQTYDDPKVTFVAFNVTTTSNDNDEWWDAIADFHTEIPDLVDNGLMGYYFVIDVQGLKGMAFVVHVVNQDAEYLKKILEPLSKKYSKKPFLMTPLEVVEFPTFYDYWSTTLISSESVAGSSLLPSRLIPKRSLAKENKDFLKAKLVESTGSDPTSRIMLGHLVAGPGVANHPNKDIGLNPAWREAYVHLISPMGYTNEEPGRTEAWNLAVNSSEYALRQIAPDSGAYLNEALPNEKNFQWSFFGPNYARLYGIKQKYDPDNVFWCRTCVGSESYIEGKDGTTLCKAPGF